MRITIAIAAILPKLCITIILIYKLRTQILINIYANIFANVAIAIYIIISHHHRKKGVTIICHVLIVNNKLKCSPLSVLDDK